MNRVVIIILALCLISSSALATEGSTRAFGSLFDILSILREKALNLIEFIYNFISDQIEQKKEIVKDEFEKEKQELKQTIIDKIFSFISNIKERIKEYVLNLWLNRHRGLD